jgi:hypothetical protein
MAKRRVRHQQITAARGLSARQKWAAIQHWGNLCTDARPSMRCGARRGGCDVNGDWRGCLNPFCRFCGRGFEQARRSRRHRCGRQKRRLRMCGSGRSLRRGRCGRNALGFPAQNCFADRRQRIQKVGNVTAIGGRSDFGCVRFRGRRPGEPGRPWRYRRFRRSGVLGAARNYWSHGNFGRAQLGFAGQRQSVQQVGQERKSWAGCAIAFL